MLPAATEGDNAGAPGIETTEARTDPIDRQATGDPGTSWTTRKADPIDHLGPGDPETQTMAAVTDQGRQGGQVHHPIHLLHPPLRHGRQDWDKGWQRSRVADGRTR